MPRCAVPIVARERIARAILHPDWSPVMYATLSLNGSRSDDVQRVPDDALVFRDGKVYVPTSPSSRSRTESERRVPLKGSKSCRP